MIICFYARYAGSSHDSLIWNISSAKRILCERDNAGEGNSWLLDNADYPLEPYLMTPYRSVSEESAEAMFNTKHAKTRNIIERTIGLLKTRFRCLLGDRQLHYKPEPSTQIANVCAAWHNVCIKYNIVISNDAPSPTDNFHDMFDVDISDNSQNIEASQIRQQIKESFL
ncbi:putative nuclease HARBI1 [Anastrepha obliqua]|uniref:putative nuclease HARBI1 n=1 Tax=Anastrepha obliqua TaxID=95512 RepID=UPI002409934D|nr:putative nuclease HARBI1 [Anastrepha obliqua]